MNQNNNTEISQELAIKRKKVEKRIKRFNFWLHPFLICFVITFFSGIIPTSASILGISSEKAYFVYKLYGLIIPISFVIRLIGVPLLVSKYKKRGEIDEKFSKKMLSHYGVVAIIMLLLFGSCIINK